MQDEFPGKAKGLDRTWVTNTPLAAAAAMGRWAVQRQEDGQYFRQSASFVPMIDGLAPEEANAASAVDQIDADFKGDWVSYLTTTGLPACGLEYITRCSPEEYTMAFLNAYRRIPAAKPRTIHESRELSIPSEYLQDYKTLVEIITSGGDLRAYLSRDIQRKKKPYKNDGLLDSWGIQHLHFRTCGTDKLLFCMITESDVFAIQTLPHAAEYLWVNTQLIQIIHDNWPDLIIRAKHPGLQPEIIPASKRHYLRNKKVNFAITVADGTVYQPPAGGRMASGDSQEDRVNCDKIFRELQNWQDTVTKNVLDIRTALNMTASKKLIVQMAFDNRDFCFYEPTQGVRLDGFAAPANIN